MKKYYKWVKKEAKRLEKENGVYMDSLYNDSNAKHDSKTCNTGNQSLKLIKPNYNDLVKVLHEFSELYKVSKNHKLIDDCFEIVIPKLLLNFDNCPDHSELKDIKDSGGKKGMLLNSTIVGDDFESEFMEITKESISEFIKAAEVEEYKDPLMIKYTKSNLVLYVGEHNKYMHLFRM